MAETPPDTRPANRRRQKPLRLKSDPHAWALVIGAAVAVLTLLVALVRQYAGAIIVPANLVVWVLLAFVIGYGAGGCFVYLIVSTVRQESAQRATEQMPEARLSGGEPTGEEAGGEETDSTRDEPADPERGESPPGG
ncbi:MAG: hypothetical protein ACLFTT_09695 [Candidatus Hydrogenedentota bacterium]